MYANKANVDVISKLFFRQVRNLTLRNKEKGFLEWPNYKKKVDFLDDFLFQQDTRKQNIRNILEEYLSSN